MLKTICDGCHKEIDNDATEVINVFEARWARGGDPSRSVRVRVDFHGWGCWEMYGARVKAADARLAEEKS